MLGLGATVTTFSTPPVKPDINKRYQNLSLIVWTLSPHPMHLMFRPSTSTIVDTVSTWELLENTTSWLIMQDRRCLLLTVEEGRWMKSSTRTHYEPLSIISSLTQYHCPLRHIRSRMKDVTMSKHIIPCALFNTVLKGIFRCKFNPWSNTPWHQVRRPLLVR